MARSFRTEPGGALGNRHDMNLILPEDAAPGSEFSLACSRPCETDIECCYSDICSNKRCEGFFKEKFPKGYPLGQPVDWSNSTEVEYWEKLSMSKFC